MFRRCAVLVIHGFAGGTYDQEYLTNFLELERKFDVYSFTLPGHDTIDKNVTRNDWIKAAETHIEMLKKNGYKSIYVIGHSMGGVIATLMAVKYKEVKKLVLLAPAFKYLALDDYGNFSIIEGIKKTPQIIKSYGKNDVLARIFKIPVKSVFEFVSLVKENEAIPKEIAVPTLIIQGLDDDVVPVESSKYVYNLIPNKNKEILFFENANHDLFKSDSKDEINMQIKKFLK